MKILILLALLDMACITSGHIPGNTGNKVGYQTNIDSLKWKMYVLSYNINLIKMVDTGIRYQVLRDSVFKPVECELKITKEIVKNDTVEYYIDFQRLNEKDRYRQPNKSYVGIGFVKKSKKYFPIHGNSEIIVKDGIFYDFFEKREQQFIAYLKTYKGNMTPWLKHEALKRNILN